MQRDSGDETAAQVTSTLIHVLGAKKKQDLSWEALVRKVQPWIEARVAQTNLPGVLDVEDLVQIVLCELVQRLDAFELRSRVAFHAWVHLLIDNKIKDCWRYARAGKRDEGRSVPFADENGREPEIADGGMAPSSFARSKELASRIARLLEKLPAKDREILALKEDEQLSMEEIAERMGYEKSETVRKRFDRAREKRSRLLQDFVRGLTESGDSLAVRVAAGVDSEGAGREELQS